MGQERLVGREGMRKAGEMGGSYDPTGCFPLPVCPDTGYRQDGAKSGVKGQGVYITWNDVVGWLTGLCSRSDLVSLG